MITHQRLLSLIVVSMVAGCAFPVKFTGGGWMPSTSGSSKDKANFGFNAADCDPEGEAVGHFNFHDLKATGFAINGGVKLGGFVVGAGLCTSANTDGTNDVIACDPSGILVPGGFCPQNVDNVGIDIEYESTNPKLPGSGEAVACVKDNGQGSKATSDWARILVLTGPFAGYTNTGTVKGNLQQQGCTCTDGVDNDGDTLVDEDDPGCQGINGLNGDERGA